MKKNKTSKGEILNLLINAGEKHGYLNLLKVLLEGVKEKAFNEDLTMENITDTLFSSKNGYMNYIDSLDIANIVFNIKNGGSWDELLWEIENMGFGLIKLESLADQIRFEEVSQDFEKNTYQLSIAV